MSGNFTIFVSSRYILKEVEKQQNHIENNFDVSSITQFVYQWKTFVNQNFSLLRLN